MKKIPMATEEDEGAGWTLDFDFINRISTNASRLGGPVGMEETENVLRILKNEGYVDIDLEEEP